MPADRSPHELRRALLRIGNMSKNRNLTCGRAGYPQASVLGYRVSAMTSVRIEALDPTDPRSQAAITQFLNEMVERVGADVLEIDVEQEARDDSGKNFFVVALDDRDNVVGCGSLRQVAPKVGQIARLWVNKVLRGRSIGRRLLSALEGAGAVAGFDLIRLEVYEALSEAILMFETSGYVSVNPWEQSPPDLKAYEKQIGPVIFEEE